MNGETRQQSSTKHMIRKTASLISYISHLFTLEPGDVILTGAFVFDCRWRWVGVQRIDRRVYI